MYQVNIKFHDGRKGHMTELFPTKGAAEEAALIWWLNQGNFDDETEVTEIKYNRPTGRA